MTEVDITELCRQLERTKHHLDAIDGKQQAMWLKAQEKFQAIYVLLNKNTETDRRTYESLRNLRAELQAIKENGDLKLTVLNKLESHQLEKTQSIEQRTKKEITKVSKLNTVVIVAIFLLFFLYLREDIAAGDLSDAILTLISASGVAVYGLHRSGGNNENS